MEFTLTDEQEQMQTAVREFLESNEVIELARRQLEGEDEVIDELWEDLSDMDYTAITVPLDHRGLGEDILYTTLLLEEAGRVAMPGPYPETMTFAVPLLTNLGTDDQKETYLPAIADGELRMSFALYEEPTGRLPADIQMDAERSNGGYRLTGKKTLVPYGGLVDRVIVAARTQNGKGYDGITLFLVDPDDAETTRIDSLDETRPFFTLTFDDIYIPEDARLGPLHESGSALQSTINQFQTAICGMMIGAADRAVELSVQHGKEREAFGHPVGRYQAVKHRIVNMWMDMQAGRSLVYYAAWALSTDDPEAPRAVAAAKSFCGEYFPLLFRDDIQNHGAMGFTWDHDTHIYLKQAKAWEHFLGSPEDHRERIAEARRL